MKRVSVSVSRSCFTISSGSGLPSITAEIQDQSPTSFGSRSGPRDTPAQPVNKIADKTRRNVKFMTQYLPAAEMALLQNHFFAKRYWLGETPKRRLKRELNDPRLWNPTS